jgi:DNA-binding LacI/PurR family transcriptional regulator
VTLKDVAARAGVSYQTVSKVINGNSNVAPDTEAQIWKVIDELGYRINVTARSLRKSASGLIGYTWTPSRPDRGNPVLDLFLTNVVRVAEERGFHVLLFPSPPAVDQVSVYRELMRSGRVDGFIVTSTNYADPRIRLLMDEAFPFVAFGQSNPEWNFPFVDVDGAAGIRMATDHLLEQGHCRIALLAWPGNSLVGDARRRGYCTAMETAGISVDPGWISETESSHENGYAAVQRLLSLPEARRPTAVVAVDDQLAIGAMRAAVDCGLHPGYDLGITGFDDTPGIQFLHPPLTSVRQPVQDVAQRLTLMLVDSIHGQIPAPAHVILPPRLIVRESSLCNGLVVPDD